MLDLEMFEAPTATGLDVVSLAEMKQTMRISPTNTHLDTQITDAINEVVDSLGGPGGVLNRTILPTVWTMHMDGFPLNQDGKRMPILLPFPNVISVVGIEAGGDVLSPSTYVVATGKLIPTITSIEAWPSLSRGSRALSVTYEAGYTVYPKTLKRLVKMLAAHWMENIEATINEPRQMMVNRAIEFGYKQLIRSLRVDVSYDDWNQ